MYKTVDLSFRKFHSLFIIADVYEKEKTEIQKSCARRNSSLLFTATPPACALVALTRFSPAPCGAKTAYVGGGDCFTVLFHTCQQLLLCKHNASADKYETAVNSNFRTYLPENDIVTLFIFLRICFIIGLRIHIRIISRTER